MADDHYEIDPPIPFHEPSSGDANDPLGLLPSLPNQKNGISFISIVFGTSIIFLLLLLGAGGYLFYTNILK